jgi:hypothetical protein
VKIWLNLHQRIKSYSTKLEIIPAVNIYMTATVYLAADLLETVFSQEMITFSLPARALTFFG